ncbi:PTS system trehalose-specific EIIBC component [Novibacillus thermophilus]|jgi:PTS system trehalose-specific IIC component|uniref:PTS trehalose transporter subunit IIBC n=1 Tax=Novibacillus thermophilus TaxID=1471761 RepID=A0A1U9K944_9BACL|nr:PTS system trehalose-specific EIIBC component [Novibacillus thermophilus]AQS56513.1 PTS trehalose transporter subunit IIBC [Novibacillus thermophilus]
MNDGSRVSDEKIVYAPMSGEIQPLHEVPDQTFSQKLVGDGLAIEPREGKVVAPFDGKVLFVPDTKHAIGLRSDAGVEILIHIGLETVSLDGEGFEVHVQKGDRVKTGDLLVSFDLDFIKEHAASVVTPVVITKESGLGHVELTSDTKAVAGETILMGVRDNRQSDGNINTTLKYRDEAKRIVEAVGGAENIQAATHCVTRLRFALLDEGKVNQQKLDGVEIVKGSFSANGQFQVVIGQGTVDKVYAAVVREAGIEETTKEEVKAASTSRQNPLQRAVKVLADIFIPILPAIVTAGLLMGINNILTNPGIFYEGQSFIDVHQHWAGLADMINIIANTAFTFLPALIGWSAVKRFEGSPLLGVVLGLVLVHPDLLNAWSYGDALREGTIPTWDIFGLEIEKIGYQGQVLPVLFASWVLAKIEIFLKQRVLDALQLLVVAPVALLVTGFLTFIVVGPVTFAVGNWITDGLVTVFDNFAVLGGLIYGAIYAPLVVTGMHHTFLAVDLQLIGNTGSTFLWPILALSNIAQGSAALAMMFASKNEKLRGLSLTSWVSAWLGITEPAMFGVNLRFKYPFIAAITGSAIAGALITVLHVRAASIGVGGVPGILSIIPDGWLAFVMGMAIVIVIPFVLTFALGVRNRDQLK